MRLIDSVRIPLLVALAGLSVGCGKIEVPLNLALAPGSQIALDIPFFPPPYDHAATPLLGGVETTAIVDLDPWTLISPDGLVAAIRIDDLLIAGEPMLIGGAFDTGTICALLDPAKPSGGLALIQPFRHQMDVQMTLNTRVTVTDPVLSSFLPDGLPFPATVDATIPVTLGDLINLFVSLITGKQGGFTGLEITQEISSTLPPDVPLLAGAQLDATLTLVSVNAIPADPLLADCAQ